MQSRTTTGPSGPGKPTAATPGANTGITEAVACYLIWGVAPIYWKLLSGVSALEVLAWRMMWAAVCMIALCSLVRHVKFMYLLHDRRAVKTFLVSGLIITVNWGIYIWATNNGFLLEASLGYYLCPLVIILFGMFVFHEKMTRMQTLAFCLAALGVVLYLVIRGGAIWITVVLAVTFGAYGAVKKRAGYPALPGMAFESLLTGAIGLILCGAGTLAPQLWTLTPPHPDAIAVADPMLVVALLIGSGVLTAVPLLLFSSAVNHAPMVVVGFLQYIAPTIEMFLAVFMFGEQFTFAHAVSYGLVWIGLAAVGIETVRTLRKLRHSRPD